MADDEKNVINGRVIPMENYGTLSKGTAEDRVHILEEDELVSVFRNTVTQIPRLSWCPQNIVAWITTRLSRQYLFDYFLTTCIFSDSVTIICGTWPHLISACSGWLNCNDYVMDDNFDNFWVTTMKLFRWQCLITVNGEDIVTWLAQRCHTFSGCPPNRFIISVATLAVNGWGYHNIIKNGRPSTHIWTLKLLFHTWSAECLVSF